MTAGPSTRRPAGDALVPQPADALTLEAAHLLLQLPLAQGRADHLAGRGVVAAVDGSLDLGVLLACDGDGDLVDLAHGRTK